MSTISKLLSYGGLSLLAMPIPFVMAENLEQPQEVHHLSPVMIKGQSDDLSLYSGNVENSITRTEVPLSETPRSIQVISQEQIKSLHAQDLRELYRYMVGVSPEAFFGQFFSRGFRTDHTLFVDGMRAPRSMEHVNPKLNNIERVENHRGPSGVSYGPQESPGGLINMVSKKPSQETDAGVEIELSENSTYQVVADATGAISKNKQWLYRIDGSWDESDTFRDGKHVENLTLTPSLSYVSKDKLSRVDFQFKYLDDTKMGYRDRGLPFVNNSIDTLPIESTNQEESDIIDSKENSFMLGFDHDFDNDLKTTFKIRYQENEQLSQYHEPDTLMPDNRTLKRTFRRFDIENEALTLSWNFLKKISTSWAEHHLGFGWDYSDTSNHQRYRIAPSVLDGGQVSSLDIYAPVYGQSDPSTYLFTKQDIDSNTSRVLNGFFLQDQLKIGKKLNLLASLRWEQYDDKVDSENKLTNTPSTSEFNHHAITYRLGGMYQIVEPVGLFASFDQTYEPQNPNNQDPTFGGPFDPQEATQWEVGFKSQWLNHRLDFNTTYYQIVKTNVVQGVPGSTTNQKELLGEIESKGFEFELQGKISADWRLMANYATNDIKITEDSNPANIGTVPAPVPPKRTAALWLNYTPLSAWEAGAGMNYVSERAFNANQSLPAYMRWDANVGYEFNDHMKARVHVENIFDEKYFSGGYGALRGGMPGNPRTFSLNLAWRI